MDKKRRDNKGRVLRTGETQRPDGSYVYRWKDENGKTKAIYAWRLVATDRTPDGKRDDLPLREKIAELEKRRRLHGNYAECDCTVRELAKRYIAQKKGVRKSTQAGYKTVLNMLEKDSFGSLKICDVKTSDAKLWLIGLQDNGRSYSTIHTIRGVLRPAFQMAVDDDLLIKNPFGFELASVLINDSVRREAITEKQERQFLEFVKNDEHFCRYYEGIYILFKTGLRISEFCGLTKTDIDMKNKTITVDHQLMRGSDMEYVIEDTKTENGVRVLPMADEVYECFQRILKNRKTPKIEPMIDGHSGFLYLDKNGMPLVALHWEKYFQHICKKYNKTYKIQMPKVTPHD